MDFSTDNFDLGYDLDYSYMDDEDFGLAKFFSKAPLGIITPGVSIQSS